MASMPDIERFLDEAGYQYHCFISWPRTINRDLAECAIRLKDAIEQDLAYSISQPRIFLDTTSIAAGHDWRATIGRSLCRSVSLLAVCAPIYYHPSHPWCRLEWSAMDQLGRDRLAGQDFGAIIPVVVRGEDGLPSDVQRYQHIDLSKLTVRGRRYYATGEFKEKVQQITARILTIAETLSQRMERANCDQFQLPEPPPVHDVSPARQPFPFRK